MPLPIIAVAIPVLHSSGGWIAATGGSYIAGTLSTTWIGAFVLGNAGFLAKIGLISAASYGALSAGIGTASAIAGTALTKVGLGKLAISLGLAPSTFLGMTAPVWGGIGGIVVIPSLAIWFTRKQMRKINT
jgi:hypothetical protein